MAVPTVFSPILPQDFTLTPIRVNKQYVIQRSDLYDGNTPLTSSGYKLWEGLFTDEHLKLETRTYPTNSWDGTYKHIIWKFIDNRYYRNPYDKYATVEHANNRFTYKNLGVSASVIVVPQGDFGEGILPGSIEITGSLINLTDDKNGNLYDISIDTGSIPPNYNLVARWDFSNLYRTFPINTQTSTRVYSGEIPFISHTFTPDFVSRAENVAVAKGTDIMGSTGSQYIGEGYALVLNYYNFTDGNSYVITDNRDDFNFTSEDDFTISFWAYGYDNGPGSILSKRGVVRKKNVTNVAISQSYINESTNIYPYDFYVDSTDKIHFRRSDGINIVDLSASFGGYDQSLLVTAVKTGSMCLLYLNSTLISSGSDRTLNPVNNHCLMFGNTDTITVSTGRANYLNDVRIYNTALTQAQIATLAASDLKTSQTAVVGNVFYKTGTVVINSVVPKYRNIINSDFTFKFKNTHTIYQYEILSRIKKGSSNLTLNPSARRSPYSDLLINDFTGSLYPYVSTIGFYNDTGELLAVGKLSQPLQMRDDVDINIITRMDV